MTDVESALGELPAPIRDLVFQGLVSGVDTGTAGQVRAQCVELAAACDEIELRAGLLAAKLATAWRGDSGSTVVLGYSRLAGNAKGQAQYARSLGDQTESLITNTDYTNLNAIATGFTLLLTTLYQMWTLELGAAAEWAGARVALEEALAACAERVAGDAARQSAWRAVVARTIEPLWGAVRTAFTPEIGPDTAALGKILAHGEKWVLAGQGGLSSVGVQLYQRWRGEIHSVDWGLATSATAGSLAGFVGGDAAARALGERVERWAGNAEAGLVERLNQSAARLRVLFGVDLTGDDVHARWLTRQLGSTVRKQVGSWIDAGTADATKAIGVARTATTAVALGAVGGFAGGVAGAAAPLGVQVLTDLRNHRTLSWTLALGLVDSGIGEVSAGVAGAFFHAAHGIWRGDRTEPLDVEAVLRRWAENGHTGEVPILYRAGAREPVFAVVDGEPAGFVGAGLASTPLDGDRTGALTANPRRALSAMLNAARVDSGALDRYVRRYFGPTAGVETLSGLGEELVGAGDAVAGADLAGDAVLFALFPPLDLEQARPVVAESYRGAARTEPAAPDGRRFMDVFRRIFDPDNTLSRDAAVRVVDALRQVAARPGQATAAALADVLPGPAGSGGRTGWGMPPEQATASMLRVLTPAAGVTDGAAARAVAQRLMRIDNPRDARAAFQLNRDTVNHAIARLRAEAAAPPGAHARADRRDGAAVTALPQTRGDALVADDNARRHPAGTVADCLNRVQRALKLLNLEQAPDVPTGETPNAALLRKWADAEPALLGAGRGPEWVLTRLRKEGDTAVILVRTPDMRGPNGEKIWHTYAATMIPDAAHSGFPTSGDRPAGEIPAAGHRVVVFDSYRQFPYVLDPEADIAEHRRLPLPEGVAENAELETAAALFDYHTDGLRPTPGWGEGLVPLGDTDLVLGGPPVPEWRTPADVPAPERYDPLAQYVLLTHHHSTAAAARRLEHRYRGVIAALVRRQVPDASGRTLREFTESALSNMSSRTIVPDAGMTMVEWCADSVYGVVAGDRLEHLFHDAPADRRTLGRSEFLRNAGFPSDVRAPDLRRARALLSATDQSYYRALIEEGNTVAHTAAALGVAESDVAAHGAEMAEHVAEHLVGYAPSAAMERRALVDLFGGDTARLDRAVAVARRHFRREASGLTGPSVATGQERYRSIQLLRFLAQRELPGLAPFHELGDNRSVMRPPAPAHTMAWLEVHDPDTLRQVRMWLRDRHPQPAAVLDLYYSDDPAGTDIPGTFKIAKLLVVDDAPERIGERLADAVRLVRDRYVELSGMPPPSDAGSGLAEAETPIPYHRADVIAEALRHAHFTVELVPHRRRDVLFRVDGELFGCLRAQSTDPATLAAAVRAELRESPLRGIVVDLADSHVAPQALGRTLADAPDRLPETHVVVAVDRRGVAHHVYPPGHSPRVDSTPTWEQIDDAVERLRARLNLDTPIRLALEASLFIDERFLSTAVAAAHPEPEFLFGRPEWAGWLAARDYLRHEVGDHELTSDIMLEVHRRLTRYTEPDRGAILRLDSDWGLGLLERPLTEAQLAAVADIPGVSYHSREQVDELFSLPTEFGALHYDGPADSTAAQHRLEGVCDWFNAAAAMVGSRDEAIGLAAELERRIVAEHFFPHGENNGNHARALMHWALERFGPRFGLGPSAVPDFDNDLYTPLDEWIRQVGAGVEVYRERLAGAPASDGVVSSFRLGRQRAAFAQAGDQPRMLYGRRHYAVEFDEFRARLAAAVVDIRPQNPADPAESAELLRVLQRSWVHTYFGYARHRDSGEPLTLEECERFVRGDFARRWLERFSTPLDSSTRRLVAYGPADAAGRRAVVGYVTVELADPEVEINGLYLLPEYEGRGYGSALLEQVDDMAEVRDRDTVAGVTRDTAAELGFYRRKGFQPGGWASSDADDPRVFLEQVDLRRRAGFPNSPRRLPE